MHCFSSKDTCPVEQRNSWVVAKTWRLIYPGDVQGRSKPMMNGEGVGVQLKNFRIAFPNKILHNI